MFGDFQGINPMVLSAYFNDFKNKQYFTNIKISTIILRLNSNIYKEFIHWAFVHLGKNLSFTTEKISKLKQQNKDDFFGNMWISQKYF